MASRDGRIGVVAAEPIFEHEISFDPAQASEALRQLPAGPAVVALFGHSSGDRPHLMKTANARQRLKRLLEPAEGQTKRLNLRDRIARIAWREAGSEFELLLLLYRAMLLAFGADEARKRMRLSPPFTIRFAAENRFPRIYVTNHLRRRSLPTQFGPFASRLAAERYCEAVEELFVIRRCFLELHPSPDDPGCIYGEMKKCMAPCQERCTDAEYSTECAEVLGFLRTRGGSRLAALEAERDAASAAMEFEAAAAVHGRIAKVKSAAAFADELVQPLDGLRAVLVMPCASHEADGVPHVAVWSFSDGCFCGPERVSLLGVRLAREQAEVGSSLFAQPMMLAPVPEDGVAAAGPASAEERMAAALTQLFGGSASDTAEFGDQLSLLKRWYYRPDKQRVGAIFFAKDGAWPVRRMVRAGAKMMTPAVPAAGEAAALPVE